MSTQLPRPGESYQFTEEEFREYVRCSQDPVYFIRNYMKIIHVDWGLIPFELYDYQEQMIRSYHQNRFNITMTSRQSGKSTTVIAFFLWLLLFNTNYAACISANKQKTAADLLGRLKLAYENLPRFLQQGVTQWAKLEIELENGSKCFAAATSSSAVRGGSYAAILVDEFAFVPQNVAEEFYTSTFPTITSGKNTKVIIVSTPNGYNLFYEFWSNAKAGRNDFVPIAVNWDRVPGRDEEWKQNTIRNIGGPEKFAQEYENSFLSSSYTMIRPATLQSLTHEQPIFEDEVGYRAFAPYEPDHAYLMIVDTASGQGLDYSTFVVVDITSIPFRVVATYANNRVTTMEFPTILMRYAALWKMPWLIVEVMDIGRDVAHVLAQEYEYENLITTTNDGRQGQRMTFGVGAQKHPGVRMTVGVKKSGCAILKAMVENQQLILRDYRIIQQLASFVQYGAIFAAEPGHHDDLVMPLVVLGWLSVQSGFAEITNCRVVDQYKAPKPDGDHSEQPAEPDSLILPDMFGDFVPDDDDDNWVLR